MRSLHNNSNVPPSSQGHSQAPSHQSWAFDKINVLQSDVATTKLQLDHLKKTMDTRISNHENGLTTQINALNSKFDLKFDTFKREVIHSISELRAELKQHTWGIIREVHRHEVQLVWRVFIAVSSVIIFTIYYLLIVYSL